ncbi:beta-lactamase family protein [Adhaeribacter swui]|uniref:Beta-lactamase family protein n=1 Tax=Adhaeribacter swui TaxID=2086471 RepID=A0A7G7GBE3_9BACT|nr:serine hydrolase domain-containing protein [Adhaeribacter swui]QNF34477.1 beta-lactamase family protein [Adhaeribacter swui]
MKPQQLFVFSLLLLVVISPIRVKAQGLPEPIVLHINHLFRTWNNSKTPGAAIAIIKYGQVIYQQAYGMAHVAHQEKLTPDHTFWVASMAKQFTALSVALLAEEGKLSLNDDIRKYLPQLPDLGDTVRIRHLIHHTSGLHDGFTLIGLTFKGEKHYTNQEVIAAMAQQKSLNFKPGTRYEYLNSGYVLLAEIVAQVSKKSFAQYTQAAIFRPLGMTYTQFAGNFKNSVPQLATGYGVNYKDGKVTYRPQHFKGNTVGSSGLFTTLSDLTKWDANLYHNQLGKGNPALIKQLLTPDTLNNGTPNPYGFGLEVGTYQGYQATSHSGADPGYKAEMVRFPDQRLTLICLANTEDQYSLTPKLLNLGARIIQGKVTENKPAEINKTENLSRLTGYYLNPENHSDLSLITEKQGKLFAATSLQGYQAPLVQTAPGQFQNDGLLEYAIYFRKTDAGEVAGMVLKNLRENEVFLQKVKLITLNPENLKKYASRYYSPELNKTYRLTVKKGKLGLKIYGIIHVPFQPLEGNQFLADLIGNNCFIFQSDTAGNITGFSFNRNGVTNLTFTRHL